MQMQIIQVLPVDIVFSKHLAMSVIYSQELHCFLIVIPLNLLYLTVSQRIIIL